MSAQPVLSRNIETKPRLRVVSNPKLRRRPAYVARAVTFGILAFSAFMASSLLGNVLLETVRQEGKSAMRRSLAVREHQSELQRKVIALEGANSIENWAKSNGFVTSDRARQTSSENSRVAINR